MKKFKLILMSLITLFFLQGCSTDSASSDETNNQTATLPVVTTSSFTNYLTANPKSGGNISSDGGSPVIARGIVWGTTTNPTILDSKTLDGMGIGTFVSTMTGLSPNTKYYVRAYATNSKGTSYGNEKTITTVNFNADLTPALMTANIDGIQFNNLTPYLYSSTGQDVTVQNNGAPAGYPRFLRIQGDRNINFYDSNYRQINLHIPDDKWKVGTYDLYERYDLYEGTACQGTILLPFSEPSATITSGKVTVTEFNLTTKRIKGTFSFSYKKSGSSTIYEVTNGTFNYGLDDDYFN